MRIKSWIALTRVSIMDFMQFRLSAFVMLIGNIIYLIVIYNLWKAIYASVDNATINGMSFNDTMIYLVLASAQFTFMEAYLVWMMSRSIQSGNYRGLHTHRNKHSVLSCGCYTRYVNQLRNRLFCRNNMSLYTVYMGY